MFDAREATSLLVVRNLVGFIAGRVTPFLSVVVMPNWHMSLMTGVVRWSARRSTMHLFLPARDSERVLMQEVLPGTARICSLYISAQNSRCSRASAIRLLTSLHDMFLWFIFWLSVEIRAWGRADNYILFFSLDSSPGPGLVFDPREVPTITVLIRFQVE